MSDYHIMSGSGDGNSFTVVFHIPVSDTDNEASVNYRTALTQYLASTASAVPWIDAGEQTQLDAGELYEHQEIFHTYPEETALEKRGRLDARFTALSTSVWAQLQYRLSYWGYDRDVS